ncbi:MAG TPA: hypothetical protein VF609_12475 [Flavisolibacter sp.]
MKSLMLILLFLTIKGFSQDGEYLQADTVYKMNGVKTCTVRFYGQQGSRIVFNFDITGRLIDRIQFNPRGKKFYNRHQYHYNDKGQLTLVSYFTYWHLEKDRIVEDSLTHPSSDWTTCMLNYDSGDRLVRTLFTNAAERVFSENTYTYNPLTLHSEMYSAIDSTIVTATILYDASGVVKRYNSYREKAGKVISKWEEVFENSFDKKGRILKRRKTIPSDPSWAMEYVYEYDNKGLLMVLNSRRLDCTEDCRHRELLYEYSYWEENCVQSTVKR